MITIIGGGLAGCEAAWQAASLGVPVVIHEMRPVRPTAVHKTDRLAELVCSNSFRGDKLDNAVGLLKEEMRRLGSIVMRAADAARVPAGAALAVDRERFSEAMTSAVSSHPLITIVREEVPSVPAGADGPVIIATGPLTSDSLSRDIARLVGGEHLYFYDAISPIVLAETIDLSKVFRASRWGRGDGADGDYLNCPFTADEYAAFHDAVMAAEKAPLHEFDDAKFFEGCLPIEVMAARGVDTLRFGPMKPVGLTDPRTGREAYAVAQLRQDNLAGDHFSLVGFQTQMKWGEQARVLRLIPGLENAEFVRFGMIHRNTYINGPDVLRETWQTKSNDDLFFAGQISGVEGYVESAASGLIAGRNAAARAQRQLAARAAADDRDRRARVLRVARRPASLSAHEHHVRDHAADRRPEAPAHDRGGRPQTESKRGAQARPVRAGAGRPRRVDEVEGGRSAAGGAVKDVLDDFLEHLRLNENASAHTVRAYESDLSQYFRFLSGRVGRVRGDLVPADFDHLSIREFLGDRHRRGNTRSSAARKLAALRAFGRYLRREGVLDSDPAALVGTPKREVRLPAHLGEAEMSRLLEMPDGSHPLGRRDRAILELFYASGLRLSELVGLDLEDVNLSSRVVRVLGKGGKERIVPFNRKTEAALRACLADREYFAAAETSAPPRQPRITRQHRQSRRGNTDNTDGASAVPQLSGWPAVDAERGSTGEEIRRGLQHAVRHQPARAAALVCDAPARAGRGPTGDPGAARSRAPEHDATLHARQRRAVDGGVPKGASEGVAIS